MADRVSAWMGPITVAHLADDADGSASRNNVGISSIQPRSVRIMGGATDSQTYAATIDSSQQSRSKEQRQTTQTQWTVSPGQSARTFSPGPSARTPLGSSARTMSPGQSARAGLPAQSARNAGIRQGSVRVSAASARGTQRKTSAADPDWMDTVLKLFMEAHPSFATEVCRVEPGRYIIRGRNVVATGRGNKPVSIDGWQRPLADCLEDFWHEFILEHKSKAGAVSRKLLSELLEQEAQNMSVLAVRGLFTHWRQTSGVRARRLSSSRMNALRRWCFTSWLVGMHVKRADAQSSIRLRQLHACEQKNWLLDCTLGIFWSAWCMHIHRKRTATDHAEERDAIETSTAKLRFLQDLVPLATDKTIRVATAAGCCMCFLRWSREVQFRKRQSSEYFLRGQAGALKDDINTVHRQSMAKDLLASSFEGPHAQLCRLSGIVDGFLNSLDLKARMPLVAPRVHNVATKYAESWHGTMEAFQNLAQTHRVAMKLQTDVTYVLALRCFSAWVRAASDTRESYGLKAMQIRQVQLTAKNSTLTARYNAFFAATDASKTLRRTFTAWAARVRLLSGRSMNRIFAYMGKNPSSNSESSFMNSMMGALDADPNLALLIHCNNGHALTAIIAKWVSLVNRNRGKELQQIRTRLDEADARHKRRLCQGDEASQRLFLQALMTPLRISFEAWAAHNKDARLHNRIRRRRVWIADLRMRLESDAIVRHCFTVFVSLLTWRQVRRIMSEHWLFKSSSESIQLIEKSIAAWFKGMWQQRCDRARVETYEICSRVKMRGLIVLKRQEDCYFESMQRWLLRQWLELASVSTQRCKREERWRMEKNVGVMRERARAWRLRIDKHLVEAWETPIRFIAFKQWVSLVQRASQEDQVAKQWLQRQRYQDRLQKESKQHQTNKMFLLQSAHAIADGKFRCTMLRAFQAWRWAVCSSWFRWRITNKSELLKMRLMTYMIFKSWRCTVIQGLVSLGVFQYAQAAVACSEANFVMRIFLAWQGLIAVRKSWIAAKRLLALQGIAPLILRAPRAALNQWRRNAQMNTSWSAAQSAARKSLR